jgi:hypothetical protein
MAWVSFPLKLSFALAVVLVASELTSAAFYAPNRFLGTCLTDSWVKGMETKLGVAASARDSDTNRLLNPFLHAALPGPRYSVRHDVVCGMDSQRA